MTSNLFGGGLIGKASESLKKACMNDGCNWEPIVSATCKRCFEKLDQVDSDSHVGCRNPIIEIDNKESSDFKGKPKKRVLP